MYPSSLQDSIRELDRQISLLETECENMESEKKENSMPLKNNSKLLTKQLPNKPFITGPCFSSSSYATKRSSFSQVVPKVYSASCSQFIKSSGHNLEESRDGYKKVNDYPASARKGDLKFQENHKKFIGSKVDYPLGGEIYRNSISPNRQESMPQKKCKSPNEKDGHDDSKRSISSIRELSETSDDNTRACPLSSDRKNSDAILKDQIWVSHINPKVWNERWKERVDESTDEPNECSQRRSLTKKPSSERGSRQLSSTCSVIDRPSSEKRSLDRDSSSTPRNKIFTKRRSRSLRTKKNSASDVPTVVNFSKSLEEKEIQCMLFSEESEKTEFLTDVNNSIKTLQLLIGELKAKSSEERKRNVLNDMQKTLEKISSFKSINAINNPLNTMAYVKGRNVKILENDESIVDLKKILLGVKLYCQELSDEKQAMMQKLSAKNRTIEGLKNTEKEYLSLISSLKYNLEKLKEEAEDGARALKDLKLVKAKLQEEKKVIEALKKSHEKMQDLIENYVLENDKLRAQVKMAKLESQKFTVLLSGKEAEIYKYKKEIELFQRQITEQLNLLRSKASENQVAHTIEVIKKQSIFQTEMDSCPSETTFEKEFNENSPPDSKSLESVSTDTRNDTKYRGKTLFTVPGVELGPTTPESRKHFDHVKEPGDSIKDAGFTSCKSDGSELSDNERKCQVKRKRANSENSNGIQETLQNMRMNSSKNFWPLAQNSSNTTQCTSMSNTSETETKSQQNF